MQNLGGAIAERIATGAANALYASYRMARLGTIVIEYCRRCRSATTRCRASARW